MLLEQFRFAQRLLLQLHDVGKRVLARSIAVGRAWAKIPVRTDEWFILESLDGKWLILGTPPHPVQLAIREIAGYFSEGMIIPRPLEPIGDAILANARIVTPADLIGIIID